MKRNDSKSAETASYIENDELLADFVDWMDQRSSTATDDETTDNETTDKEATPSEIVSSFLTSRDEVATSSEERMSLERFCEDLLPTSLVAAEAITHWLEPCNAASTFHDTEDEILPRMFGDYELLELVGHGGMGVVYRAKQKSLGRIVGVKMLPPGLLQPKRMRQFAEEARLAGGLHYPGIVPVFDAGTFDNQPFYAMEYIEGDTLAQRIARKPLSAFEAATMSREIAEAVFHANEAGILHRDLKPSNVLVDKKNRIRVTDFGLARHVDDTASAGIAGTPSFMAPEQVRGEAVDQRTDVYGLGAILYEMLSGRPPHLGNSPVHTMRLVQTESPISLSQLRPGTPRDLTTVCQKAIEKNPRKRYGSANEFAADLSRFLNREPVLARPIGLLGRGLRWFQRHPAAAIATTISLVSLVMLFSGVSIALWQTRSALKRSTDAETRQSELSVELTEAIKQSDEALYRSLIVQTVRHLETPDVPAARDALRQIEALEQKENLSSVEFRLLQKQAYPESAFAKPQSEVGDNAFVRSAQWSFDGQFVISTLENGAIARWDNDARLLEEIHPETRTLTFDLHPSSHLAAVAGGDGSVELWSTRPLKHQSRVCVFDSPIRQLAWHPIEDSLIVYADNGLSLVSIETGKISPIAGTDGQPSRFSVSPNGDWMVVATQSNHLQLFPLTQAGDARETSDRSKTISENGSWNVALCWSSSSQRLAALEEGGKLTVWEIEKTTSADTSKFQEQFTMMVGSNDAASLAWDGDDLTIGRSSGLITVVDTQHQVIRWRHPCLPLQAAVPQPHGNKMLLVHNSKPGMSIWDCDQLGIATPVHDGDVPIRKVVVGNHNQFVAWRDIEGRISVRTNVEDDEHITISESAIGASAIAASPNGPLLAITRDQEVIVYQVPTMKQKVRFELHKSTVWTMKFSPDGKWLFSADAEGKIGVQSLTGSSKPRIINAGQSEIRAIEFLPKNEQLAAIDADGKLTFWDVDNGSLHQTIELGDVTVHAMALAEDSTLFIGDSTGHVWRIRCDNSNHSTQKWQIHDGPVWSLLSVGSRIISSGQDGNIFISDQSGKRLYGFPRQSAAVWSLAQDPDGDSIWATTTSGSVLNWNLSSR